MGSAFAKDPPGGGGPDGMRGGEKKELGRSKVMEMGPAFHAMPMENACSQKGGEETPGNQWSSAMIGARGKKGWIKQKENGADMGRPPAVLEEEKKKKRQTWFLCRLEKGDLCQKAHLLCG